MQSRLPILFIDDHPGLRDGTSVLLSQKDGRLSFFCAGTADEAAELLQNHAEIALALVDLNLDGEDGISAIRVLRAVREGIPVIVYTMHTDPFHIRSALEADIQGYVDKKAPIEELLSAIITVADGGIFFNKAATKLVSALLSDSPLQKSDGDSKQAEFFANYKALSKSEQQLFLFIAQKLELSEIARIMGKSEKTILNKRTMLYQKLKVHDRLDVIECARLLGVIE